MKTPDQLLRQLERQEVAELLLAGGKVPRVKVGSSHEPVDAVPWSADDILSLLMTFGGSRYVETLGVVPKQWTSRLGGVGIVAISAVVPRGGAVEVRFSLAARDERTRPPTMPRRPDSGPPVRKSERPPAFGRAERRSERPPVPVRAERRSERPPAPMRADRPPPFARAERRSERPNVFGRAERRSDRPAPMGRPDRPPTGSRRSNPPPAPTALGREDLKQRETMEAPRAGRPQTAPFGSELQAVRDLAYGASAAFAQEPLPPPAPTSAMVKPKRRPGSSDPPSVPDGRFTASAPRSLTPPTHGPIQPASASVWDADGRSSPGTKVPVEAARQGRPATRPMGDMSPVAPIPPPPVATTRRLGGTRELEPHLKAARDAKATDVHVVAGRPLLLRVAGDLRATGPVLPRHDVERMLTSAVPDRLLGGLEDQGSCDFALDLGAVGRFRVNVGRQQTGLKASVRVIPRDLPTLEMLGLPAAIGPATRHHQGLIVVTGPTGHGKTSTLAAIVDILNEGTTSHIITVEDPIEYVYPKKKALVSQREIGTHTRSFASALKGALREDPDVIVVGELRDAETVRMAVSASETGHLVLGTMNTPSAAKTIDRLIDLFPPADQPQVRTSLASGLRLVVGQRLVPSADKTRMHVAVELLPGSVALSALIREAKTFQIPSLQQRGKGVGIHRMDDSLAELVQSRAVTLDVARSFAEAPFELDALVGMRAGGR